MSSRLACDTDVIMISLSKVLKYSTVQYCIYAVFDISKGFKYYSTEIYQTVIWILTVMTSWSVEVTKKHNCFTFISIRDIQVIAKIENKFTLSNFRYWFGLFEVNWLAQIRKAHSHDTVSLSPLLMSLYVQKEYFHPWLLLRNQQIRQRLG
jgi:hypothetical protein